MADKIASIVVAVFFIAVFQLAFIGAAFLFDIDYNVIPSVLFNTILIMWLYKMAKKSQE